jgi:hypothetical protein
LPFPRKIVPAALWSVDDRPLPCETTNELTGLDTDVEIAYHQEVTAVVTCDGRAGP